MIGNGEAISCVASAGYESTDRLAGQRLRPLAGRDDGSRNLQTGDVGSARRRGITAEALEHVGPVDPGEGDLDQNLAGTGRRNRTLLELQHLRPAWPGDSNGLHGCGQIHPFPPCPDDTVHSVRVASH